MIDNSSPGPPINTFVVRFWRERAAAGPHWRGTIEHVQSGTRAAFLDLVGLASFIQHCGIMILADEEGRLDEKRVR